MAKLPAYMVPTYILAVSCLPLSVNNKVDLKALRALYESTSTDTVAEAADAEDMAPNESLESITRTTQILADFLRIPVSGIMPSSRLFELGLDSVSAIGLARAFKRSGLQQVDVSTILKHPVVRELARAIVRQPATTPDEAVQVARSRISAFADAHRNTIISNLGVQPSQLEHIAHCTPLQEGMISRVTQSESHDTVYFARFRYRLNNSVDTKRLEHAWNTAQACISILRTFFIPTEDGYAQAVLRDCASGVASITLKTDDNGDDASSIGGWVRRVKSFGPTLPWKVEVSKSGYGNLMDLYIFHGLYDGTSLPLLIDTVKRCYNCAVVTPRPLQFYEALTLGPLCQTSGDKDFWSSCLANFSALKIPSTLSRSSEYRRIPCTKRKHHA